MTERRAVRRYDLSLPVSIRLSSARGSAGDDSFANGGKTRNISPQGIYFLVEPSVVSGAALDITVTLTYKNEGGTAAVVRAKGTVVRVEERSETMVGVAAVIGKYEIVRVHAGT